VDGLIEIEGVQLAYGRSGDGPPLVLLHGGSARRELWDEFTPLLEDAYRVYTPDLRALAGRGETATEIAALLRQLSTEHADGPWLDRIAAGLADHDPEFLAAILDRCEEVHRALDPLRLLPAIRCPLILLQGDAAAGGLLSDDEVELALRLVPTARVERVAELILGFLPRARISEL
jgi:pimeloyl-ACP methyl ester carboxylesterase